MTRPLNIVSFSGGKDSTAMLLRMFEEGIPVDRVICVDTTKEFPEMYTHIEKVQSMIPVEIEKIKIEFDYYFSDHVKTKGKNAGQKGYGFPNMFRRWCTRLKIQAIQKLKEGLPDHVDCIGIAIDEMKRAKQDDPKVRYPLIEWGMTEQDCLDYCYKRGLDWGGLYKYKTRVSCWMCPLQNLGDLKVLYFNFPNLWSELRNMQTKARYPFRMDYSLDQLENKFKSEGLQLQFD